MNRFNPICSLGSTYTLSFFAGKSSLMTTIYSVLEEIKCSSNIRNSGNTQHQDSNFARSRVEFVGMGGSANFRWSSVCIT